ncbi:MAG: hypothetical protein A3D18_01480 [Chlamydiae bacterium RIFCSPHIGHO2_02_FULL_49_29]|nr:MAG: hypothetical protein A3D18_01480 [Chlamydiae bacterium RIFCSPHIGHO2_02_FULL_49_29]
MLKFFCLFFLLSSLCLRALFGELEESAPLLTIEESVRLAQERNKTIEIAGFRIEQAIASKNEMRSALLPALSAEGVWDNRNDSLSGDLTQFQDFKATKALGLSIKQLLWDFGVSWKRFKASQLRIRSAKLEEEKTSDLIEEQVRFAYLSILEREKNIQVLRASLITLNEQLLRSEALHKEGLVKTTDLLTVGVQIAEKKQQLLHVQNEVKGQKMVLNHLIGLPLFETPALKDMEELTFSFSFEEILDHALSCRPDYLCLKTQIHALELEFEAAQWSSAPLFYAFGNGNYASNKSTASAGIGVSIPLYTGGRKGAQSHKLKAEIQACKASLADLENRIAMEIKNACLQFEEIKESFALSNKAVCLAEESLHNNINLYQEGIVSIHDLLLSQEQLIAAKTNFFSTRYRSHMTYAHLKKIMGGDPR